VNDELTQLIELGIESPDALSRRRELVDMRNRLKV
jgi:hypothetical protein